MNHQDVLKISLSLVVTLLTLQISADAAPQNDEEYAEWAAGTVLHTDREKAVIAQHEYLCQLLVEQAKKEAKENSLGKAEACFSAASKAAEKLEPDLRLRTMHHQAEFYNEIKQFDRALETYSNAYQIFLKNFNGKTKKRFYFYRSDLMKNHAHLFADYALVLQLQDQTKKADKIRSLSKRLNESVEHETLEMHEESKREAELTKGLPRAEYAPGYVKPEHRIVYVDYGPYAANMGRIIKTKWVPLTCDSNVGVVKILSELSSDGTVVRSKFITKSASTTANDACLKAVTEAKPTRPFPAGAPGKFCLIHEFASGENPYRF